MEISKDKFMENIEFNNSTNKWGTIMDYFRVRNFEKYQPKRKTKHAPWVCLYVNWINDWAIGQLHDSHKAHWIGLICVAHTTNNQIPYDAVWIKKRVTGKRLWTVG